MKKLYYRFDADKDHYSIDEIIAPVVKNVPSWFEKLTPYINGTKTVLDAWRSIEPNERNNARVYSTAKMCPSFHNLFRNSFLVKFPCDMMVEYDDNNWVWNVPSNENPLGLGMHSAHQHGFSERLNNYHIMKFEIPLQLTSTKNLDIMFFDPIYWESVPYRVAPGVMNIGGKNSAIHMNVIVFFEKNGERNAYHFRKGQPMCLMNTSEKVQLTETNDIKNFHRKRFASSFKWDR